MSTDWSEVILPELQERVVSLSSFASSGATRISYADWASWRPGFLAGASSIQVSLGCGASMARGSGRFSQRRWVGVSCAPARRPDKRNGSTMASFFIGAKYHFVIFHPSCTILFYAAMVLFRFGLQAL